MERYDLAVIGGGASGLAAAAAAARELAGTGRRVAVLEKNPRVGKKLLSTGNGRCNLTNRNACAADYHGDAAFIESVLDRYPPERIVGAFSGMGLVCRELDGGRVYPYSLQASSVLNVLRRRLELYGVETVCGFAAEKLEKAPCGFAVAARDGRTVLARRAVLAAGGMACPQSGSCGDGYAVLKALGHSVAEPRPALVQVKTDPARVRPLRGLRSSARAFLKADGKVAAESEGEVQFAENALSGICIFDLSRYVPAGRGERMEISLDLMPEYPAERIAEFLGRIGRGERELPSDRLAEGIFGRVLGAEVVRKALPGPPRPSGSLTERELARVAGTAKDFSFPAEGTFGWEHAQVTAGGVSLREVDGDMQSRLCPGLFLCGELLDADGNCGGFNLHWAWSTGFEAGAAAARSLKSASSEREGSI